MKILSFRNTKSNTKVTFQMSQFPGKSITHDVKIKWWNLQTNFEWIRTVNSRHNKRFIHLASVRDFSLPRFSTIFVLIFFGFYLRVQLLAFNFYRKYTHQLSEKTENIARYKKSYTCYIYSVQLLVHACLICPPEPISVNESVEIF